MRRALENTCLPVGPDEPAAALTYGCGLMQVTCNQPHPLPACHGVPTCRLDSGHTPVAAVNLALSVHTPGPQLAMFW